MCAEWSTHLQPLVGVCYDSTAAGRFPGRFFCGNDFALATVAGVYRAAMPNFQE